MHMPSQFVVHTVWMKKKNEKSQKVPIRQRLMMMFVVGDISSNVE